MNKLLIVLLAVCLVSVHALVKREVPATESSTPPLDLDGLFKQGKEILNKLQDAVKEQAGNFQEEAIKAIDIIKNKIDAGNKGAATGA